MYKLFVSTFGRSHCPCSSSLSSTVTPPFTFSPSRLIITCSSPNPGLAAGSSLLLNIVMPELTTPNATAHPTYIPNCFQNSCPPHNSNSAQSPSSPSFPASLQHASRLTNGLSVQCPNFSPAIVATLM